MDSNQMEVSARARALGVFVALYTALPSIMPLVFFIGTYCLAQSESLKDLQPHLMVLSVGVLPLLGMLVAASFSRTLGAWYARSGRRYMLVAALAGLTVHLGLILFVVKCTSCLDLIMSVIGN